MIKGCLIGRDVRYSYSKKIHEAKSTKYDLISLEPNELDSFFCNNDYDFINVTMPYKTEVIKYLNKMTDVVRILGVCNLIRREKDGYVGYNTDYLGFIDALEYYHIDYKKQRFLLLGTGGASRAVGYALCINGCFGDVVSRAKDGYLHYDEIKEDQYDLIINATPHGMAPDIDKEALVKVIEKNKAVIDLIYNPFRTNLLMDAGKKGIKAINGIAMLVFQALRAYGEVDLTEARALIGLLEEERNIVLIGMPYSGKSTIGRKLLEKYPERDLYDIDDIIEERYGKIEDIFSKYGEDYFRDIEEEVIKEVALKHNAIIIPGGGFFKRDNNVRLLKMNGYLYYVDKSLEEIKSNYINSGNNNRPLIKNINDLEKLYQERKDIYPRIMDKIFKGEDYDNYSK